ncbi:hypothetical protein JTE90_029505 [Oedothorax gibbosus]|uniref:Uncharacterized protein n=1 Tax=Oedothorax gibbosus TaxID=931172 RepID=A0AAV6UF96_9ARAC|nr:hypothetical protein JTE90_029505 [Oedothorax gibbosus]
MLMVIVLALAALLNSAVSMQVFGQNEEDVMDCGMYMLCKEEKTEFWDVMAHLGQKAREKALEVTKRELKWDDLENIDEKWMELPDRLCPMDEAGRRKFVVNIGDTLANFWGVVCDEDNAAYDLEECDKVDETATAFTALLKKKIDNKECGMAAKAGVAMKGFGK